MQNTIESMETGIVFFSKSQNLGDDIQSYAAAKLVAYPKFIEREHLNTVDVPLRAILSGWFMQNPENFPPSEKIKPLFISFHGKPSIICDKYYEYYKKHEPIGCRDYDTLRLFESIGIKAYFSGCATLTLSSDIGENMRGDEILVVDLLRSNYTYDYRNTIKKNLIPEKWKDKVSYFSHLMDDLPSKSIGERLKLVEDTLLRYAKAKLVITSLIHCALPCLALGTPVLFVDFGFNKSKEKRDRFDGITELMNIYSEFNAPLSKRNFLHTTLRMLRIHRLLQKKIKPIPIRYFEETVCNPPMNGNLVEGLINKIHDFESSTC